jgi:predicted P-loop ATPase/GTPase
MKTYKYCYECREDIELTNLANITELVMYKKPNGEEYFYHKTCFLLDRPRRIEKEKRDTAELIKKQKRKERIWEQERVIDEALISIKKSLLKDMEDNEVEK